MAVSNYLAKSEYGCRYHYNKLKDTIYIVPDELVNRIVIDNGEAFISGSTGDILRIDGYKVEYKEETSLDERYKFQKTLTFGVNGIPEIVFYKWVQLDQSDIYWCEDGDKYYREQLYQHVVKSNDDGYYLIIETMDGAFYLINPDFKSKQTFTYNLSDSINQTDFNFTAFSNFPALEIKNFTPPASTIVCKNYVLEGADKLQLIESAKVELAEGNNNKIISTESLKDVEYLGKSLTLQESYDGKAFTTTIEFQIAFNAYKTSWHYNLLEFIMNKYAAIIKIKGTDNYVHAGFKEGLQVNYSIQASNGKDQTDIVTITMVETTKNGIVIGNFAEEINTNKHWRYIKQIGNKKAYDCISGGVAKYLLQEECDYFGNPTGKYKVLSGYESWFPELNIDSTFSNVITFYNPTCSFNDVEERWVVVSGEYECSGTTKMTKQKKQISYDGGSTWTDTSPLETRASLPVIAYYSSDCGIVTMYRWVTISGQYECSGTTKMTKEKKQVSNNGGSTWTDVSPLETRAGSTVIQYNSSDCGYVPSECKYPGATIQLMIPQSYLAGGYDYFVITDEIIGSNCEADIDSNGAKLYGTYTAPISLGYYQYTDCTLTTYDSGSTAYCDISAPGGASCDCTNKTLTPGSYYFYGHLNGSFVQIATITIPTAEQCQEYALDLGGGYIYYVSNIV